MVQKKSSSKGEKVSVDLSNAGTSAVVPEGDHSFKVISVEKKIGQDSGQPYLVWKLQCTDSPGTPVYENTSLQDQSLFALRGMLEACGYDIPKSKFDLNLKELEGLELGGTVFHEVYDGKKKAKLSDVFPLTDEEGDSEDEEEEEEFDEDADESDEDADESDEDEEIDLEAMTLSDLKKLAKEYEVNVAKTIKPAGDNKKKQKRLLIAALEELLEGDEEEEE